jgi:hypothetical protein
VARRLRLTAPAAEASGFRRSPWRGTMYIGGGLLTILLIIVLLIVIF